MEIEDKYIYFWSVFFLRGGHICKPLVDGSSLKASYWGTNFEFTPSLSHLIQHPPHFHTSYILFWSSLTTSHLLWHHPTSSGLLSPPLTSSTSSNPLSPPLNCSYFHLPPHTSLHLLSPPPSSSQLLSSPNRSNGHFKLTSLIQSVSYNLYRGH